MAITSRDIGVPFIISIMTNVVSAYLFSLKKINLMIFISVVSIMFIIILGFQLKINELKENLDIQKTEQKRLDEKLKIYKDLAYMKEEIKTLQKKVNYNGKK